MPIELSSLDESSKQSVTLDTTRLAKDYYQSVGSHALSLIYQQGESHPLIGPLLDIYKQLDDEALFTFVEKVVKDKKPAVAVTLLSSLTLAQRQRLLPHLDKQALGLLLMQSVRQGDIALVTEILSYQPALNQHLNEDGLTELDAIELAIRFSENDILNVLLNHSEKPSPKDLSAESFAAKDTLYGFKKGNKKFFSACSIDLVAGESIHISSAGFKKVITLKQYRDRLKFYKGSPIVTVESFFAVGQKLNAVTHKDGKQYKATITAVQHHRILVRYQDAPEPIESWLDLSNKIDRDKIAHFNTCPFDTEDTSCLQDYVFPALKDPDGNFYPVRVLNTKPGKIFVHYIGWQKKYDEWLDLTKASTLKRFKQVNINANKAQSKSLGHYLKLALEYENRDAIKQIIIKGLSNKDDIEWLTKQAIQTKDKEVIDWLMAHCNPALFESALNLSRYDDKESHALLYALKTKANEFILSLIQSGASLTATDSDGVCALDIIIAEKNWPVLAFIIDNTIDILSSEQKEEILYHAVFDKQYAILKQLISHTDFSNSFSDPEQKTALHLAIDNQDALALALLLMSGINVDLVTLDGLAVATYIKQHYKHALLDVLAHPQKYAEPITYFFSCPTIGRNAQEALSLMPLTYLQSYEIDGKTALTKAAGLGLFHHALSLIAKGLDINAKDSEGYCPLHRAIIADDYKMVAYLIEAGANPNITTATDENAKQLIETLARKHAIVNKMLMLDAIDRPSSSISPYTVAVLTGNQAKIKQLAANADIAIPSNPSPIELAIETHQSPILFDLLKPTTQYDAEERARLFDVAVKACHESLATHIDESKMMLRQLDAMYTNRYMSLGLLPTETGQLAHASTTDIKQRFIELALRYIHLDKEKRTGELCQWLYETSITANYRSLGALSQSYCELSQSQITLLQTGIDDTKANAKQRLQMLDTLYFKSKMHHNGVHLGFMRVGLGSNAAVKKAFFDSAKAIVETVSDLHEKAMLYYYLANEAQTTEGISSGTGRQFHALECEVRALIAESEPVASTDVTELQQPQQLYHSIYPQLKSDRH